MATFSVPIAALAEKMQIDVETIARKVTLDIFSAVVKRSPVDTGRFKGNWNASYGAPDYTVSQHIDKTPLLSAGPRIQRAALALPVGGVTFLSNGLPYAKRLEDGWSKQAPGGMVKLAQVEFSRFVEKATKGTP